MKAILQQAANCCRCDHMLKMDQNLLVVFEWLRNLAAVLEGRTDRLPCLHQPLEISIVLAADYVEFAALWEFVGPFDCEVLLEAPFKRIVFAASSSDLGKDDRMLVALLVCSQRSAGARANVALTDHGLDAIRLDPADLPLHAELETAHPFRALTKHGPFQF